MTKQTNRKPGVSAAASATAPDAYTRITNRIVADLEQGVRPWCKPWGGDQLGARITRPRRANGKPYSGINTLILWLEAVEKGHRSPTWMTYRQAQQLGGQVRRGERGSQVVYMGETTKTRRDEGTGEETEQGVRFLKTYTVFNVGQIEGLPEAFAIPAEAQDNPHGPLGVAEHDPRQRGHALSPLLEARAPRDPVPRCVLKAPLEVQLEHQAALQWCFKLSVRRRSRCPTRRPSGASPGHGGPTANPTLASIRSSGSPCWSSTMPNRVSKLSST